MNKTRWFNLMTVMLWVGLVLAFFLVTPTQVLADDCLSDPLNAADCMRTPGFRTIIIIGVGIAGTLAAIAAELATQAAQAAAEGKEPPEQTVYVLNPSVNSANLEVGKPFTLTVNGYKVTKDGYQIEPETVISITSPPDLAQYADVQTSGSGGTVTCTVTLNQMPPFTSSELNINGKFPKGEQDAKVTLGFDVEFAISPVNSPNITYSESEQTWRPPDLTAYFRAPGTDSPLQVGFKYGFPQPPLTFNPDILDISEAYTSDGGLTYTFKLAMKPDVDLESFFGKDLTGNGGKVNVKVTVRTETQKEYPAETNLVLSPQLKMIAHPYDGDTRSTERPASPYEGLELTDTEFIADGIDVLPMVIFFIRTDVEVTPGEEYLEALDLVEIKKVTFTAGPFPDPEFNQADSGEGEFCYKVQSSDLVAPPKDNKSYSVRVEAAIKPGGPRNYSFASMDNTFVVKPQFLKFNFWVVPGRYRDTSDAFAMVRLLPSKKGVPNMDLRLSVISNGSGFLQIKNSDDEQKTCSEDMRRGDKYAYLPKGAACWGLKYSGMNWKNLSTCSFTVECQGPEGKYGPIWKDTKTIDVNQNVNTLLTDLFNDAEKLQLTNPAWKDSSAPYHLRGPIWNIMQKFDSTKPYVCHWLRTHIMNWLAERRFYKNGMPNRMETMSKMNGIEFEYCSIYMFHVWANLFLSGTDHVSAAKALDPWWEQRWTDPALKSHENLITCYTEMSTHLSERGLAIASITEIVAGVLAIAGIMVAIGVATGVPLTLPSAMGLIKTVFIPSAPAYLSAAYGPTPDIENYKDTGEPVEYQPKWFVDFINDLGKTSEGG